MKQTKKGQITIFIILGIIFLLAAIAGTYFATKAIIKPRAVTTETALTEYVQECIKQTATQAVKLIGDNAGYTSIENNPYKTFNFRTEPAEGDGITISEFGLYSTPYWWYMKTPNTCNNCYLTSDNMPVLPEIEEQINEYIAKNINKCVMSGKLPGYLIEAGEPEIETRITKDKIIITANYPIEAVRGGTKTKLTEFQAEVKVKIGEMHALAEEIINLEKENGIIEERIMHMLGAHMGASFEKLPPISEITHEYYLVQWNKEIISMQIKQILNSYVPLLRFIKTQNENKITTGSKYEKGFYNGLQIPGLTKEYPFDASISYNDWPIYFKIRPDTMTGTSHKQNFFYNIMQPFQTNTYEFYYDLSAPLLIQITDKEALNGEGYTMTFAIEANIRDNKDMTEWNQGEGTLGQWDPSAIKAETKTTERKQGECIEKIRKYQCSIDEKIYDTIMQCAEMCYTSKKKTEPPKLLKTKFCTSEQQLSGTIQINTKSKGDGIEEAGISYSCGNYQTCTLGITDSEGTFTSKLPICYGGILTVHKEGYYTEKIPLTTQINEGKTIGITLKKEKEYTMQYRKYKIDSEDGTLGQLQKPSTGQTVLISIERIKETPISAEFIQTAILAGEKTSTIKLIPGTYKISIQYMDEIGIVIPAECKKICTKEEDGNCTEYKKLPEENMLIKPAMLGGAELDSETGYWTVTEQMIDSDFKNIQFYTVEVPTPTCIDTEGCVFPYCKGLDEMGKTKEYSLRYRSYLEPKMG